MRKIFFLIVIFMSFQIHANEDFIYLDEALQEESEELSKLPAIVNDPRELFSRTDRVLRHFRVPPEPNYQEELNRARYTTSESFLARLIKALDPKNQFGRFFTQADNLFLSYRDRDSKAVSEYYIRKAPPASSGQSVSGLRGLRVVLDPGHMGGPIWDKRTGKYVDDGKVQVSEGLIALQTALMIEQKLKAQGAEVLLTHRGLTSVSPVKYEDLSIDYYGRQELRIRSLSSWFMSLLQSSTSANLEKDFENSSAVKKLFSPNARSDYYAKREDLLARDRVIKAFNPDLVINIHFDADQLRPNPKVTNRTRAYVPGAFGVDEFSTSESRASYLLHLAQGAMWQRSVRLSELIIGSIASKLNVPIPQSDVMGSVRVAEGVFARNLALTRMTTTAPSAFLEALYYGNPEEFKRLARTDGGSIVIDGKAYPYSMRLKNLADAIYDGIAIYAQSQHAN